MNDRYQLKEKIGEGGNGAVYRAYDAHLEREVAIKRIASVGDPSPEAQQLALDSHSSSACARATAPAHASYEVLVSLLTRRFSRP
ncbi:MAG: hypothetical protein AAF191_12785, partial [Verrucomicrobiota bacterium]